MRRNKAKIAGIPFILAATVVAAVILGSVLGRGAAVAITASDFVRKASIGNEFEIESSQLALQKSQNDEVRQFAQRMIEEHAKAGQDLNFALAVTPDARAQSDGQLDHKYQSLLDELSKTSESYFDKKYINDQVKVHDDAVDLFKSYAKNGDNPALKEFAARTLPMLHSHQQDIRQIHSSL